MPTVRVLAAGVVSVGITAGLGLAAMLTRTILASDGTPLSLKTNIIYSPVAHRRRAWDLHRQRRAVAR